MTTTDRESAHLMQVSCRDVELPSHCNACDRDVSFRLPVLQKTKALGVGAASPREKKPWWDIKAVFPVVCPHEDCHSWTLLRIEFTSTFVKQNGAYDAQFMDAGHVFHDKSTTVLWPPRVRPLDLEGVPSGII